jgi:hypothetical protein
MVIKKWNGSSWVATYPDVQIGNIEASGTPSSSTFLRGDGAWATISAADGNNYLTGVSGSGDGTVTFTRQGLSNLTWDASHTHSEYVQKNTGYIWTGTGGSALSFRSQNTIDTASSDQAALEVYQDNAGEDAFMQFHISGDYAKYFGLHGGINDFVVGGWSSGASYQRLFHDGYHPNADKLTTTRNIALTGAVTGNANFDGSGNISISTTATSDPTLTLSGDASGSATFTNLGNATLSVTVADDSHNHIISNVDGLQTALNAKQDSFGDVSTTILPTNGQVLKWNASASEWQPGNDNNTDTNTTYSAGSGLSLSGTTFSHSDTSSQASVNNSGTTFIQDITLDTYGHITGLASSTISNNIAGSTFMTAYDPAVGSVLQYGAYGWQTLDVGSQGQILTVGGSNYNQWSDNNGGWQLIKSGSTTLSSGTTVTNVTLSSAIGDTDVIAFELNTGSVTSYTSQVHIVKIENSSSTSGGVLYNQYASSSLIRVGSIRVYRGINTTTLSFSNVYYFTNGSSAETADTVYIGSIWKLNGRVGA